MGGRGSSSGNKEANFKRMLDSLNDANLSKFNLQNMRSMLTKPYERAYNQVTDGQRAKLIEKIDKRLADQDTRLNNKESLISFIKRQTDIDVANLVEPRAKKSGLGLHLEKLNQAQVRNIQSALNYHNLKIEDNGGFGSFIRYESKKG